MIVLSGADVVVADGIRQSASVVIDGDRIAAIESGPRGGDERIQAFDLTGHLIVPGFIDVHVHGVDGVDVLDGSDAISRIAGAMPKYGVTAFCPTTVACSVNELKEVLQSIQ